MYSMFHYFTLIERVYELENRKIPLFFSVENKLQLIVVYSCSMRFMYQYQSFPNFIMAAEKKNVMRNQGASK